MAKEKIMLLINDYKKDGLNPWLWIHLCLLNMFKAHFKLY